MSTVFDLKPSITQMSLEDALALIKETRFLRRQAPPPKKTKKKTAKAKPISTDAILSQLTPEQKAMLLTKLGGK